MVATCGLDLWCLLVENIAGGIFISGLLVTLIMIFMAIIGKMSIKSTIIIIGTFFCVFATGYVGALGAVPLFLLSLVYFWQGLIRWINNSFG